MSARSIEALTLRDDEVEVELRVLQRTDEPGVKISIVLDGADDERRVMVLDAETANELRLALVRALDRSKAGTP